MLEHLALQVLKHHVRIAQAVVSRDPFLAGAPTPGVDLSIECHDGPKSVALGDQTELPWGLSVDLAKGLHFLLLD